MSQPASIYLDNAATSFPKPEAVSAAVDRYQRELGAPVGRGAHQNAIDVQRTVDRCRKQAATLFGVNDPNHVIFTFNGTDGLNIALHGVLRPGDHVVTTVVEHNSVLRPLRTMEDRLGISVTHIDCDDAGRIEPAAVRAAIRSETKLIACIHASNVTGTIQPIEDIGQIAREADVLFLVDAAQSAGHIPIDVTSFHVDLIACPGHKGLLGPLGTGLLYIAPGVEDRVASFRQGGTGSQSEDDRQPESLPDKYESGNHNAPGLFGLDAGLTFLQEQGVASIQSHERELTERLLDGLQAIPDLQVHGEPANERRLGVVSVTHPQYEPQILAALLDEHFGIQSRAGLHCAPRIHARLGTLAGGGTVRLSSGPFTTPDEIDATVAAFAALTGGM